jgi:flagellar basal body-associated protein FliL
VKKVMVVMIMMLLLLLLLMMVARFIVAWYYSANPKAFHSVSDIRDDSGAGGGHFGGKCG